MMIIQSNLTRPEEITEHKAICDTIRLQFNFEDFEIFEDKFDTAVDTVLNFHGYGTAQSFQNMTTEDKRNHYYKPRLALKSEPRPTGRKISLYLDASLPKLLYGNNLQEVCDQDFRQIVLRMRDTMLDMGVKISPKTIATAHVCRYHCCKNIILPDEITTQFIINECAKIDLGNRLGNGYTTYANGGHCARFHANTFEVATYDKIADIKQKGISPKRCVDEESHREFQEIDIKKLGNLQVFRLEVRLNNAKTIRRKFAEANICFDKGQDITFRDVFKSSVARQMNLYSWKKICEAGYPIFCLQDNSKIMLDRLPSSIKFIKKLEILGLTKVIDDYGVPYVKKLVGRNTTLSKLFKFLQSYKPDNQKTLKAFKFIEQKISENDVIVLPIKAE
ncbi:MAG: hypothetical protein IJ184_02960 [Alphaproteobacteria bacterium]|nr:hypothetical protein [Alphaproteobacteria bacterium]